MTGTHAGTLRILLTGRDGQVGRELVACLQSFGQVTATGRSELDLASDASIRAAVRAVQPHLIVNAAAYTAVDKAESEPDLAHRINVAAVSILAVEAKAVGAAMVHYSTDYVFEGTKIGPYVEEDSTGPLNVYGRTKLAGERALADAGIPYLVLRTSWVYGSRGKNFLLTILKLAGERPELRIVADQMGAPTWSRDIAQATACIAKQWLPNGAGSGVYHLTAAGKTSWHGFAAQALDLLTQIQPAGREKFARLVAIRSAEYPTAAARPQNSTLDCGKLARVFSCRLPEWMAPLATVLEEYERESPTVAGASL